MVLKEDLLLNKNAIYKEYRYECEAYVKLTKVDVLTALFGQTQAP